MSTQFTNRQWRLPNNENKDKQSNYSMVFDGSNSAIVISSDFGLRASNSSFTFSSWINFDSVATSGFFAALVGSQSSLRGPFAINFYGTSSGMTTSFERYYGTTQIYSSAYNTTAGLFNYSTNTWYHLAIVYDGPTKSVSVYVDGTQAGSTYNLNITSTKTTHNEITIGLYSGSGTGFPGKIDGVSIFDYKLSSSQITTLYGSSSTGIGNPITLNPVAYYPLGDQDSFNGADYLVPNSSLKDYVFDFDGSNDYINIPNSTDFDFGTADFTWSFWLNYQTHANNAGILYTGATSSHYRLKFRYSGQIIFLQNSQSDTQIADLGTNIEGTGWHHISLVRNSGTITTFLDGSQVDSSTRAGDINSGGNDFRIAYNNVLLNGQMSNVQIFNTALPATGSNSVETLYNNGSPLTSMTGFSSLVSWWKLDASDTYDSSTGNWTIEDHAGSNDGTSSGMTQANLVQSDLSFTSGYSPYALDFDAASSDSVNIFSGSTPSTFQNIGNATSDYSISFWFKTTDPSVFLSANTWYSDDQVIELRGRYNQNNYNVPFNISVASNIRIGRGIGNYTSGGLTGSIVTTKQGLNDDNWHNVVVTVNNNGTPIIYIDNVISTNTGFPSNWSSLIGVDTSVGSGTADLHIGARSRNSGVPTSFFNGSLSNFSIWNTDLTSAQVSELYNEGVPSNLNNHSAYSNLVSWWQLGSNSSFNTNWTVLDEVTASGNNGTSSNMGEDAIVDGVGSYANGLSSGMGGDEVIGDAPYSTANALSVNMDVLDRVEDTPS